MDIFSPKIDIFRLKMSIQFLEKLLLKILVPIYNKNKKLFASTFYVNIMVFFKKMPF